jgi:hypothetical protein
MRAPSMYHRTPSAWPSPPIPPLVVYAHPTGGSRWCTHTTLEPSRGGSAHRRRMIYEQGTSGRTFRALPALPEQ